MPKLLTEKQAADLLGKSPHTLAEWRCSKRYPLPYVKLGGSVRYSESDVLAFIAQGRKEPVEAR